MDPDVLYVDAGSILTSAGTAAAIDACLHVVRSEHGATVANALSRRMVVAPHRSGGQAQFIESALPSSAEQGPAELLAWMSAHLAEPLTVPRLAARAAMSPRTFARRFGAATGTDPAPVAARPATAAGRAPARGHRPPRRRGGPSLGPR